jgi:hypothetical protein
MLEHSSDALNSRYVVLRYARRSATQMPHQFNRRIGWLPADLQISDLKAGIPVRAGVRDGETTIYRRISELPDYDDNKPEHGARV